MKFSFLNENLFYTTGHDEKLFINDLWMGKESTSIDLEFPITSFDFDPLEEKFIVGGYFGQLVTLDLKS